MEFYSVIFFDKELNQEVEFYVFTENMNNAAKEIMKESPQVNVLSWKQITEDELPLVAVVIQK